MQLLSPPTRSEFRSRSRDAGIRNWITDREVVDNLSIGGRRVEVVVRLIIVERADSRRSQSKRFRSKIECMADSARFKVHVAVTSIAIMISGTI